MENKKEKQDIFDITNMILEEIESDVHNMDGTIEVKAGEVYINNPRGEGKYPVIDGDENLIIIVNGQQISGPTVVSASDTVKIMGKRTEPSSSFEINVSKDKMLAFLTVIKSKGEVSQPLDMEAATDVFIQGEITETIEPAYVKEIEVISKLKEEGVIFGVNIVAIREALLEGNGKKVIIAEGNPVLDGVDAKVTYNFMVNPSSSTQGLDNNSKVDHFNRMQIKSVTIGEVIAERRPASEGVPGENVFGEEILPKVPKDIEIRVNQGVELLENGTKAVAKCSGRPVLEGRKKDILSVLPIYVVEGDVDVRTGNVKFKGDVLVKGNIHEGLKVEAGGTVEVLKNVNGIIDAQKNVVVHGNIIHAQIRAGGISALYHQVYPILQEIDNMLKKLYATVLQVKDHPSFSTGDLSEQGDGKLIKLLIDTRFSGINKILLDMKASIDSNKDINTENLQGIVDFLIGNLLGLAPLKINKVNELNNLRQEVESTITTIETSLSDDSNLYGKYIQNSNIQVSGDIHVEKQEIYNSFIVAGGNIIVNGPKGFIRGSTVIAQKDLVAKEIGSGFDTNTRVTVSSKGKIRAEVVYTNVVIQIGNSQHRMKQNARAFEAFIGNEGRIIINSLKDNKE